MTAKPVEVQRDEVEKPRRVRDAVVHRVVARPLRVCHVISADLWAGAEVQVATTVAALVKRPAFRLSAVLFNEGALADELRALGVPTYVIDEQRNGPFAIVRALMRHWKDHEVDLIHTHRHSDTVISAAAAALAGVGRMVRTVHGLTEPFTGWRRLKYRAYETLERMALRARADAIIAVSEHVASSLRAQQFDPQLIFRIHNGVDLDKVKANRSRDEVRHEFGLGADRLVVGTVGRLTAVKGHERLLRAAQIIRRQNPRAAFFIVGDGPRREELVSLAVRLGIADACIFTGSRRDTYDLVAAMDIFTLPSLSEGTPMALLEAMALGVPVVATAVGGVPEIVEDGINGLLVDSGDDDALAHACLELAANQLSARSLAARARLRATEFSAERCSVALADTYALVAASPRRAGFLGKTGPWVGLAVSMMDRTDNAIRHRAERRRLRKARVRSALRLASALRKARRILVVCHGNIIRSAFAAQLLTRALPVDRRPAICSAGIEALAGRPADPRAVAEAESRGIDLGQHTACRLTPDRVATADVIFVMDVPQLLTVLERFRQARSKTFLLTTLADNIPTEIADPILGDRPVFEKCFDHITRAVGPIVRVLVTGSQES
jgi:glycosyltransferase involved in cell wall biosynthesis/protein-tyrosine-phosphatase